MYSCMSTRGLLGTSDRSWLLWLSTSPALILSPVSIEKRLTTFGLQLPRLLLELTLRSSSGAVVKSYVHINWEERMRIL